MIRAKGCGIVLMVLAMASVGLGTGRAQDYQAQVAGQLLAAALSYTEIGFELREFENSHLRVRGRKVYEWYLRASTEYLVLAVCDQDCTDLDLFLYDENGNLIDSDRLDDDTPVVTVAPRWTGNFYVRVEMVECWDQPCYFGVGVFHR